ncbi:MAG: SGNH/GDSL hydrolase family protein [bacterium]|nr:SGNH/GDSL hydrolase family protein [bacterium]
MQRRRDFVKGVIVSLFSLVLVLGLGEVLVRALNLAPEVFRVRQGRFQLSDNPLIGYELVPHYESRSMGAMQDFPERANSLGFRDRDHEVEGQEGTFRILLLGDSITQGLFIRQRQDLYATIMENELLAAGLDVEIINFGVNGYNTRQEVETLRDKGLQFSPDLVIVAYCVNDMFLDSGGILTCLRNQERNRPEVKLNPVLGHSHLYRLAWAVRVDHQARKEAGTTGIPQDASMAIVPEALADLHQLAQTHDFDVLVATFPFLDKLPAGANPHLFDDLKGWVEDYDFKVFDLTADFVEAAHGERIYADALHPNERGAQCAGKALARYVRDEYLQ